MFRVAVAFWLFAAASAAAWTTPGRGPAVPEERAGSAAMLGQWVWSDADARRLDEASQHLGTIRPALWVATITVERGAIVQRLARDPRGAPPDAAVVVRFDDSFHE